jgi:hypothetical protein
VSQRGNYWGGGGGCQTHRSRSVMHMAGTPEYCMTHGSGGKKGGTHQYKFKDFLPISHSAGRMSLSYTVPSSFLLLIIIHPPSYTLPSSFLSLIIIIIIHPHTHCTVFTLFLSGTYIQPQFLLLFHFSRSYNQIHTSLTQPHTHTLSFLSAAHTFTPYSHFLSSSHTYSPSSYTHPLFLPVTHTLQHTYPLFLSSTFPPSQTHALSSFPLLILYTVHTLSSFHLLYTLVNTHNLPFSYSYFIPYILSLPFIHFSTIINTHSLPFPYSYFTPYILYLPFIYFTPS